MAQPTFPPPGLTDRSPHRSTGPAPRSRAGGILVLHCPAGGGHKAAALAIAEAARSRGVPCEVADALAPTPPWFARAYVGAHLGTTEHVPGFYGAAYAALNQRHALADGLRGALDRAVGAPLLELVRRRAPRVVVATHFFPLSVLGHARLRGELGVPLVGVVTDYTAHAFWAERGVDRFCAPAGRAVRELGRHGVPSRAIVATGIPIRPAFGAVPPLRAPGPGERLRVLVTSGGFGVGPMLDVIRSFSGVRDVELAVVCGANPMRVEQARREAARCGVRAVVIGFEQDMPKRLAEAHLVIGKPGGLTTSEALAAGRPMLLAGACPGQELQNQGWMVAGGAAVAVAAADAGRAASALRERGQLEALAARARALSAPDAAARVVDVALGLAEAAEGHAPPRAA